MPVCGSTARLVGSSVPDPGIGGMVVSIVRGFAACSGVAFFIGNPYTMQILMGSDGDFSQWNRFLKAMIDILR